MANNSVISHDAVVLMSGHFSSLLYEGGWRRWDH